MWQKHQYTAEQRGIKAKINLPEKPINLREPGLRWSPEGWWPPLINKKLISKETYTKTGGMMCLKSTLSIARPVSSRYHLCKLYSLIEGQCLGFWQTFFKAIHLFGVLVVSLNIVMAAMTKHKDEIKRSEVRETCYPYWLSIIYQCHTQHDNVPWHNTHMLNIQEVLEEQEKDTMTLTWPPNSSYPRMHGDHRENTGFTPGYTKDYWWCPDMRAR